MVWENSCFSSSSLLAAGETSLASRIDSRRDGCFRRLAFAKQYLKVFWSTVSFKTTYSLDSTSIPVIISHTANATRGHTLLERGFLMSYQLPHPLYAILCWCSRYLQKTTNTPTLNGGEGEGCGFFCSLKLPYLRADADWRWKATLIGVARTYGKYRAFPRFSSSPSAFIFFFKSPLP